MPPSSITAVTSNGLPSKYLALAEEMEDLTRESSAQPLELLADDPLRKRLLQAATNLIPALEIQQDVVQRVTYSTMEAMGARIGCQMGLFTKLVERSPMSTKAIASSIGADMAILERLLKFIASMRMIEEMTVNTWGASNLTRILANRGVEGAVYTNFETLGPTWLAFPKYLEKTNYQKPTDNMDLAFNLGQNVNIDIFQWYRENPKNASEFNHFMQVQRFGDEDWLDKFPFEDILVEGADPEVPLFVDVGGGVGHQCQKLLGRFPHLKGRVILQDQPSAIETALPVEGMKTQIIDFFQEQPIKGARAYYLRSVLHDWNDHFCRVILKHLRAATGLKSFLLLDEMVVPMKGAHKIAMQMDMTMLANCMSEERSSERWIELLASEGFEVLNMITYQAEVGNSIIVAIPI